MFHSIPPKSWINIFIYICKKTFPMPLPIFPLTIIFTFALIYCFTYTIFTIFTKFTFIFITIWIFINPFSISFTVQIFTLIYISVLISKNIHTFKNIFLINLFKDNKKKIHSSSLSGKIFIWIGLWSTFWCKRKSL